MSKTFPDWQGPGEGKSLRAVCLMRHGSCEYPPPAAVSKQWRQSPCCGCFYQHTDETLILVHVDHYACIAVQDYIVLYQLYNILCRNAKLSNKIVLWPFLPAYFYFILFLNSSTL